MLLAARAGHQVLVVHLEEQLGLAGPEHAAHR
jgi:hypothetical protein